ncbi:MAG: hypothetical protein CMJ39_02330 [Phycisphaerae bacterium]|nr:hypothetical protein [Phycisphaerae bacterium]|tara:strand:+ start:4044 stop:4685 length:642 start_codon:yes stop_codon:yes gene_type:complete
MLIMQTRTFIQIPSISEGRQRGMFCVLLAIVIMLLGASCSAPRSGLVSDSTRQGAELDASYTTLYQLLDDESQVDAILIVKSASAETKTLLREIASSMKDMRDQLKIMIDRDVTLTGAVTGLPKAEADARSSISMATAADLLTADNQEFEILILMTQEKAMSYGHHLARSLARHDQNRNRAESLNRMSAQMKSFHERIRELILSSCVSQADSN